MDASNNNDNKKKQVIYVADNHTHEGVCSQCLRLKKTWRSAKDIERSNTISYLFFIVISLPFRDFFLVYFF